MFANTWKSHVQKMFLKYDIYIFDNMCNTTADIRKFHYSH